MEIVVVDEVGGDFDEGDIAGKAAVVVPVGLEGGNALCQARAVYCYDDEVIAVVEEVCGFAIVGGEAALCWTGEFAVDRDKAAVVGCADVKEGALVGLLLVGEVALIPEWTFVMKERVFLGVPVAGDFEDGRFAEVVLGVVFVLVEEVAVFAKFVVEGIEAGAVGIDYGVPIAIEADLLAVIDVDEEGFVGSLSSSLVWARAGCWVPRRVVRAATEKRMDWKNL